MLAGCGGESEQDTGLASLAPPDVPLYAEATIRPEGSQADAVYFQAARPYLDVLGYLIAGARIDDGLVIARLVVGLQ